MLANNCKLKDIEDEDVRKEIVSKEYMDYVSLFVTKGNTKSLPTTTNANSGQERRRLLEKIKQQGEDVEDYEPDVKDIAEYVQKQILVGWKTAGKFAR